MNDLSCRAFRARLERALVARAELGELAWNRHLATCNACRELLGAEEALEGLLATLPEPSLPPALARRVVARLRSLRSRERVADQRLDALLCAADRLDTPAELPRRVLAALAAARQRARAQDGIERLLDLLPAPAAHPDLAARVLAGIAAHRRPAARRPRWLAPLALAASLLCALALAWTAARASRSPGSAAPSELARSGPAPSAAGADREWLAPAVGPEGPAAAADPGTSEPDLELLACLELLADDWELVLCDDVDALLGSLAPDERVWLGALGQIDGELDPDDEGRAGGER